MKLFCPRHLIFPSSPHSPHYPLPTSPLRPHALPQPLRLLLPNLLPPHLLHPALPLLPRLLHTPHTDRHLPFLLFLLAALDLLFGVGPVGRGGAAVDFVSMVRYLC